MGKISELVTKIKFTEEGAAKVKTSVSELRNEQGKLLKVTKTVEKAEKNKNKTIVKSVNNLVTAKKKQFDIEKSLAMSSRKAAMQELAATKARIGQINNLRGALLGMGLTMLFGGMAIKKFFEGIARGMINTFMIAEGETGAFSQSVARLQGAWAFLKWSIMDALQETGILSWVVETIINLVDWFSNLSPTAKAALGIIIFGMIAVGAVMMFTGQIMLLVTGYVTLLSFVMTTLGVSAGGAAIMILIGFLTILAIIAIVVVALVLMYKIWTGEGTKAGKIMRILVVAVAAVIAILLILGFTISIPFLIVIGLIMVIVWLFSLLTDALGGVGNAFKALGIFLLFIFALLADGIVILLISPINLFIKLINSAIKAANKFMGTNYKLIPEIEAPNFAKKVDGMRDALLAKVEAEKAAKDNEEGGEKKETLGDKVKGGISNVFNVTQQPGESSEALAQRITELQEQANAQEAGSTQQ